MRVQEDSDIRMEAALAKIKQEAAQGALKDAEHEKALAQHEAIYCELESDLIVW